MKTEEQRQKERAACKRWRERHPERAKEAYKRYTEKFPGRMAGFSKQWREKNPEKVKQYRKVNGRRDMLKTRYGLTPEEWDKIMISQSGCCAICKEKLIKRPYTDHCHATGQVRGLLCYKCNTWMAAIDVVGWKEKGLAYQNNITFNNVISNWVTCGS